MTQLKLNTTREERDSSTIRFRIESLVQDTNTLEDELARVRACLLKANESMEKAERDLYLKLNATEDERDKLREELESARLLLKELGLRITSIAGGGHFQKCSRCGWNTRNASEAAMTSEWIVFWLGALTLSIFAGLAWYRPFRRLR